MLQPLLPILPLLPLLLSIVSIIRKMTRKIRIQNPKMVILQIQKQSNNNSLDDKRVMLKTNYATSIYQL
uniref:Uncharacterized protein n=1 Tax=Wuchereria bancrofti TaxID=6293 RepID=A0AAF5PLV8_WUCBA